MSHSHPGYVLRTDLDPVIHGVALERVIVMPADRLGRIHAACLASIPQEIWLYPSCGIDWTPDSLGATNLAACILDRWLPPAAGQIADYDGRPVACAQIVVELSARFAAQVVCHIPFWGGVIPRSVIADWLLSQPEITAHDWIDLAHDPETGAELPPVGPRR